MHADGERRGDLDLAGELVEELDLPDNPMGPISLQFRRPSRSRTAELEIDGDSSSVTDFRGPDHKPHQITRRFDPVPEVLLRFDVVPKADRIAFTVRRWQDAPPAN